MEQISGFPKNLAYSMRSLSGRLNKQRIKVSSDLSEYKGRDIINFYLPLGRMINLNSIVIYAKGTCTSTNAGAKFPRYGLHSLINTLQVSVNNKILQNSTNYGYVYNIIADNEGVGSLEQSTKRITELYDPSIRLDNALSFNGTLNDGTATNNVLIINNAISDADDEDIRFCANNFLGFLGGGSVSCLDLNNLGQLKISITLEDPACLWQDGTGTAPSNIAYSLKDVYLTCETVSFENSIYQELVKNQLETAGLNIAYYDYITYSLNPFTRHNGTVNTSIQINTNSLDQCICTFRPSDYTTTKPLQLSSCNSSSKTFNEVLANLSSSANVGIGGAFNQSYFYVRDGAGLTSASWYVNSTPFTQNANAIEIFNNFLQAENYRNWDLGTGGMHPGCFSINRFMRQYYTDYLSLENISGDNNWWISGLSGNGGTIQIQYNATFGATSVDTSLSEKLIPFIICRVSKILNVKMGRALDLRE